MNKWKEVASLLGLELEEEFKIKDDDTTYKFTSNGLKFFSVFSNKFVPCRGSVIYESFSDSSIIIKKPWKPKIDEKYWCCLGGSVNSHIFIGDGIDLSFWKSGNCFRTREEAEVKGKKIFDKLKKEYENDGGD